MLSPKVVRPVLESVYVLALTGLAAWGFVTGTAAAILVAFLLALPTGLPAIVGYYLAYGLLALVPGANPDTSSGSVSCSADGSCHGSTTGDLAPWFAHTTVVIGVLAVTFAALVNLALLRLLLAKPRAARS